MAVTLEAELAAALEGTHHRPIAKIVSSQMTAEIPLVGTQFQPSNPVDSKRPVLITHSSGRMVSFSIDAGALQMAYTDIDRTAWTFMPTELISNGVTDIAAVELSSGNIGVAYSTGSAIYTKVYTPLGVLVANTSLTAISGTVSCPTLCRISAGVLLAYQRFATPNYYISKQTSNATMTSSWSASSDVNMTGLIATEQKYYPYLQRLGDGHITLLFNYRHTYIDTRYQEDLYFCHSEDDGTNFSSPDQLTTYDSYQYHADAPSAVLAPNGDLVVAFNEKSSVIHMDSAATGWCAGLEEGIRDIHFDSASGLLFVVVGNTGGGPKGVSAAIVIDPLTFEVAKCYNSVDSSPKFGTYFADEICLFGTGQQYGGDGQYMAFAAVISLGSICVINHQIETISEYHFADNLSYNIEKNIIVDFDWAYLTGSSIVSVDIDAASEKMYVCFSGSNEPGSSRIIVGYIDLSEIADPVTGLYQWHELNRFSSSPFTPGWGAWSRIFPNEGYGIICNEYSSVLEGTPQFVHSSVLFVYQLSDGTILKTYNDVDNVGMPAGGGYGAVLKNNKIYLGIGYTTVLQNEDRRGLCIIDMLTDTVTYERPTYATHDNYGLTNPILTESDTKILWASPYGTAEYTIANRVWRLFDHTSIPGLSAAGAAGVSSVAYDNTNNIIFQGNIADAGNGAGVYIYNPDGDFYSPHYLNVTALGSPEQLVEGYPNLYPAIAYDPSGSLWSVWNNRNIDTNLEYFSWAKTGLTQDVIDYLVKDYPLSISWEVDRPAKVSFTLANGHLFDPTNTLSTYSGLFKKHRLVTIEMGESVGVTEYFQSQGSFLVTGVSMRVTKTEHPIITVTCEDRSTMWGEVIVAATENYGGAAFSTILTDMLESVANMTSVEFSIPSFANLHLLYAQWVDESLYDVIDQLCNHFGIFPHWGTDGVFTFKEFDLAAAVAHVYTDAKILEWSPQDDSASYINRVTVKSESHVTHEVIYPEERAASMNGTCGWWGGKHDKIIYYSDDKTRTMRYPRLVINLSVKSSSPFLSLGGGGEEITDVDANEQWCEVTIEQPDMLMWVFALSAIILALAILAATCDGIVFSWCGYFISAIGVLLSILITVLSGVASYDYEIWARPLGNVKQMIQATANDEDFQRDMNGQVIEHTFEDPLCYEPEHCQMVADHEIGIVRAQRSRVQFKKVAHLSDEIGDVIGIQHPFSLQNQNIFIAKLTRIFTYGDSGEFSDSIEGWIV